MAQVPGFEEILPWSHHKDREIAT